ncbi:HD domain-containing protein [Cadophora sp. MPI-SDFR-AT-0126]|nr:HD domain-containing protein [Leotiomycetes sp. MPI-SDFR-AT-0126]
MSNNDDLIKKVTDYVETCMNKFDGSHDFHHIKRVVGLAHCISSSVTCFTSTQNINTQIPLVLDPTAITLSALLHDVGDRKYLTEGQDPTTQVRDLLHNFGASPSLAQKVQAICLGVSFTSEIKDPSQVMELIAQYPELAVVQDADRLDAIGSVGIGRVFTYGGARTERDMQGSVEMMDWKLFRLEGMMKTEKGREMAKERTERMRAFREWWREEMGVGEVGAKILEHAKAEDEGSSAETAETEAAG